MEELSVTISLLKLIENKAISNLRLESLTHFILIAEDVVVDVVLLWALGREHEGLHEPSHRLPVVGQLPAHLGSGDCKSRWKIQILLL